MKGNALFIVVILIAILVAFMTAFSIRFNLFGGGEGTVQKASLQSDIYTMGHALDAAELYMEASLDYSVYQACHDTLLLGSSLEQKSEEDFNSEMQDKVQEYYSRYLHAGFSFLNGYSVSLPASGVSLSGQSDAFSANVTSMEEMTTTSLVKSGESVTLRAGAEFTRDYYIPCYSVYHKGVELEPSLSSDLSDGLALALGETDPLECATEDECSRLLEQELDGLFSESGRFPSLLQEGFRVEREITESGYRISTIDRTTGDVSWEATASQRVTIQQEDPEYYPVWNGQELAFKPMRLTFLMEASSSG